MYSIAYEVNAPVEAYDALHAAVTEVTDSTGEGLLVHLARPTATGFEIIEVWESKEHLERFLRDTLPKAVAKLPDMGGAGPQPKEFELRGFLVYATQPILI